MFGDTPVAQTTRSASIGSPPSVASVRLPLLRAISVTRVPVRTATPFDSHQRAIIAPPVSSIMRGSIRSAISTTTRSTPRAASASSTMQPMKPAPISTTRSPGFAPARIRRASASVQQFSTPSESMPSIGGLIGCAPVAISSRS